MNTCYMTVIILLMISLDYSNIQNVYLCFVKGHKLLLIGYKKDIGKNHSII